MPAQYSDDAQQNSLTSRSSHWSVAVFAHNEARGIVAALDCLPIPSESLSIEVHVLANGCSDDTEMIVRRYAEDHPWVRLESIEQADKANAWNQYVHSIAPNADIHFFSDGDVCVDRESFELLSQLLIQCPSALAAGGFPMSGRNRESWCRSMRRVGNLAGGLYVLPRRSIERLREIQFRQPIGWIGEDTLLSWLVRRNLERSLEQAPTPLIVFDDQAGFTFRSLSPWRMGDWKTYWRRKIRIAIKRYQFQLLVPLLRKLGLAGMPEHVNELYSTAPSLPRLSWNGRNTIFDALALRHIREIVEQKNSS